jgi:hypothetical protein
MAQTDMAPAFDKTVNWMEAKKMKHLPTNPN